MGLLSLIFGEPIKDEDGNVEHLIDDTPLFDEDDDFIDELEMLDAIFDDD